MADTVVVQTPTKQEYGAIELKKFINENTIKGFIITVILLLLLFLISFVVGLFSEDVVRTRHVPPTSNITLTPDATPPAEDVAEEAPPPPPTETIKFGPASRAGTPVPVPDTEIAEDLKEFADMEELDKASTEGGEGLDMPEIDPFADFGAEEKEEVKDVQKEYIPDPDDFIPVEEIPQTDMSELQKSINYPEMAVRAGIQGQVVVRVYVDKRGNPKRPEIMQTESKLLNEAAIKAVMKAVWIPAIQNGQSVGCWVIVPIKFKLSH